MHLSVWFALFCLIIYYYTYSNENSYKTMPTKVPMKHPGFQVNLPKLKNLEGVITDMKSVIRFVHLTLSQRPAKS